MSASNFIENLRRLPFVRLVVPFILGILFANNFCLPYLTLSLLSLVFLVFYFAFLFVKIKRSYSFRWVGGLFVFAIMFCFGAVIMQSQQQKSTLPLNNEALYKVVVVDSSSPGNRFTKFIVDISAYCDTLDIWKRTKEKAVVYCANDTSSFVPAIGDLMLVSTTFAAIPAPKNPEEFNYANYLKRRKIFATAFVSSSDYIKIGEENLVFRKAIYSMQSSLFSVFKKVGIKGKEYAVLRALLLGDKELLDEDLLASYANAGAMHILAVSGLHVGLVFVVLCFFLRFMQRIPYGHFFRAVVIILFLWLYAALANFSPSVSRACVMFSFVVAGMVFQRSVDIYNSLAASALLLCAINPYNIFEVGFQLSYSAVLAIVYFQPILYKSIYIKNKILDKAFALLCLSVAAQIGTAAISIFYFHQFPNYFIITNILIIPVVTIIMYLVFLLLFVSFIPFLASIVGEALNFMLYLSNQITSVVAAFPYSVSEGLYISKFQLFIVVLLVVLLAFFIAYKNRKTFIAIIACIVLFFCINYWQTIARNQQKQMIVYSTKGTSRISFVDGRTDVVLCDSAFISGTFDFNISNNNIKLGIKQSAMLVIPDDFDNLKELKSYRDFIWFQNKTVKIATVEDVKFTSNAPLLVDFIIVNKYSGARVGEFFDNFSPAQLIIDSSVRPWQANIWIAEAEKRDIQWYNVNAGGAFVVKF